MLLDVMSMLSDLSISMTSLQKQVSVHETSLSALAQGELDCPRLFVLLPLEQSSSLLSRLRKPRDYITNKYRLVFLDPVTGFATKTGPDGHGYQLEVPKAWLVENKRYIDTVSPQGATPLLFTTIPWSLLPRWRRSSAERRSSSLCGGRACMWSSSRRRQATREAESDFSKND